MKLSKHFKNIIIIIVIAGAIGGIGNYYMLPHGTKGLTLTRSVVLGIIAAGVLPLFLKLISSSLLDTDGLSLPYKKYIVLISFCLLTGVFADLFLQGMYRKIFHEFEDKIAKQEKQIEVANSKSRILLKGLQHQSVKINSSHNQQVQTPKFQLYSTKPNVYNQQINDLRKTFKISKPEAELLLKIKNSSILVKQRNNLKDADTKSIQKLLQLKLIDQKEFKDEIWLSESGIIKDK